MHDLDSTKLDTDSNSDLKINWNLLFPLNSFLLEKDAVYPSN